MKGHRLLTRSQVLNMIRMRQIYLNELIDRLKSLNKQVTVEHL